MKPRGPKTRKPTYMVALKNERKSYAGLRSMLPRSGGVREIAVTPTCHNCGRAVTADRATNGFCSVECEYRMNDR